MITGLEMSTTRKTTFSKAKEAVRNGELRVPRQKRSRDRVGAILGAARELIGEKGSSGLKIHEIAERANVTAGSMYQYFPNKGAIVHALAAGYFDQFQRLIEESMVKQPNDVDDAIRILNTLLERFMQVNRDDSVLRDIWLSVSTDKTIRELEIRSSDENAETIFEAFKHLFPKKRWEDVRRYIMLIVQITPVAIRLSLSEDGSESQQYVSITQRLIDVSFRDWARTD